VTVAVSPMGAASTDAPSMEAAAFRGMGEVA